LLKMRRTISEIIILVSIVIDDPKGIADNWKTDFEIEFNFNRTKLKENYKNKNISFRSYAINALLYT
jgi:hypothetical protein